LIEKIANFVKNSEGVSIALVGIDPFYLKDQARKIPEIAEGFPPAESDYIVIDPKGEDIGIDEVRDVESFFSYSPEVSQKKYVFIFDIDRMTQQAANAFLKTLEEPPTFGVMICTTTRWYYLLPTIRSRLVRFNLAPPVKEVDDPIVKIIMEKDYRTQKDKRWKKKVQKIREKKINDLIKYMKGLEDDPLSGYLAAYEVIKRAEEADGKDFLKLYDTINSKLSGKEFFLFNSVLSKVALWSLEVEGTENIELVKFLDSVSRAKIANFNNSLTLLNILLRCREEKRGDKIWS